MTEYDFLSSDHIVTNHIGHMKRNKKNQKGFTLIEMTLTVALVFYIGLISVMFYSSFYLKNAANSVTQDLAFSLRKAQTYSMAGRQGSSWGVSFTGGSIIVFKGATYATRIAAFDEVHSVPSTLSISGFNETVFARMTGYPNATSTVIITGGGRSRTLAINVQGIVSQY